MSKKKKGRNPSGRNAKRDAVGSVRRRPVIRVLGRPVDLRPRTSSDVDAAAEDVRKWFDHVLSLSDDDICMSQSQVYDAMLDLVRSGDPVRLDPSCTDPPNDGDSLALRIGTGRKAEVIYLDPHGGEALGTACGWAYVRYRARQHLTDTEGAARYRAEHTLAVAFVSPTVARANVNVVPGKSTMGQSIRFGLRSFWRSAEWMQYLSSDRVHIPRPGPPSAEVVFAERWIDGVANDSHFVDYSYQGFHDSLMADGYQYCVEESEVDGDVSRRYLDGPADRYRFLRSEPCRLAEFVCREMGIPGS
jgi:hypothetical protein